MAVTRRQAIAALEEIALWLELKGEGTFKIRAYTNGARALNGLDGDFQELVTSGEIAKQKGFGKSLVQKLQELVAHGKLAYLDNLRAQFPDGLLDVMSLNGVGPKKAKLFYQELEISDLEGLTAACEDGRVAALAGCGEKTAAKILEAIQLKKRNASLFLYRKARSAGDKIIAALRELPQLQRIEMAGSLRRFKNVTKDADILASTEEPAAVMAVFVTLPEVDTVLTHGVTKSSVIMKGGIQCDLRLVGDDVFANALQHFSGSKDHNIALRGRAQRMGMKVSEWGLFEGPEQDQRIPCLEEADLYHQLGLCYIPPELRENLGEVERAETIGPDGAFPRLVQDQDYTGVLHCHTRASDGTNTIEELVRHAQGLGHTYLGITDHSKSSVQARGLDVERLLAQIQTIRELAPTIPDFRLLAGVECDIMVNGTLDYEDDVLAQLDYAIGAIHSSFSRSEEEQTARMIKAIEHPAVRIIAHPTGRILLRREPYALDIEKVLDAAIANNVALEFNCNPSRLDLDWTIWRRAAEKGALCSVNPDAHARYQFEYIPMGLGFCRKAWMSQEHILNCWPMDRVLAFLAER